MLFVFDYVDGNVVCFLLCKWIYSLFLMMLKDISFVFCYVDVYVVCFELCRCKCSLFLIM
jgi:hypothetical protein